MKLAIANLPLMLQWSEALVEIMLLLTCGKFIFKIYIILLTIQIYQDLFNQKKITSIVDNIVEQISVSDVIDAVKRQKKGKAMGPDDLSMESFIYGGPRLNLLLSILFNLCLRYEHLPLPFCEATIVPLVKSKIGDLADVNNYRAIAISSPVSKVLESIILKRIESQMMKTIISLVSRKVIQLCRVHIY